MDSLLITHVSDESVLHLQRPPPNRSLRRSKRLRPPILRNPRLAWHGLAVNLLQPASRRRLPRGEPLLNLVPLFEGIA
jgi:hypothetical protein